MGSIMETGEPTWGLNDIDLSITSHVCWFDNGCVQLQGYKTLLGEGGGTKVCLYRSGANVYTISSCLDFSEISYTRTNGHVSRCVQC